MSESSTRWMPTLDRLDEVSFEVLSTPERLPGDTWRAGYQRPSTTSQRGRTGRRHAVLRWPTGLRITKQKPAKRIADAMISGPHRRSPVNRWPHSSTATATAQRQG